VYGIDLGTTFCSAGKLTGKKVKIIPLQGNTNLKSLVVARSTRSGYSLTVKPNYTGRSGQETQIVEWKRIIGKSFYDETIQNDMWNDLLPFKVVKGENGEALIEITLPNEVCTINPIEVSKTLLKAIKN